jgi:arylsulfatase A-like enzyme
LTSLVDTYDTAVRYTTDQLEVVFGLLETAGVYDESLIIVTADHGEELFDHGGFSHGYSLHQEVLHVPLYVKLPFQIEGRRVEEPATLMDLLPTILALTGAGAAGEVDGRLLESLVEETADATGDAPFRLYQTARPNRCVARAIEGERYKLIEIASNYEGSTDALRLYDLDGDPLELENLAAVRPELTRELRGDLMRRFEALDRRAFEQPANRMEDLDQERLRALGYLE